MRLAAPRYLVKVPPAAWQCLGAMPAGDFQEVQRALEEVAELISVIGVPKGALLRALHDTRLSLVVGNYVAVYDIDEDGRFVTLREVARLMGLDRASPA